MKAFRKLKKLFLIYPLNLNKTLLIFSLLSFFWAIMYKMCLLNIGCKRDWLADLGEIFYPIALSVMAGYIIYLITTEYPSIKKRNNINHIFINFKEDLESIKTELCLHFYFDENKYKEENKGKYNVYDFAIKSIAIVCYYPDSADYEVKKQNVLNDLKNKFVELDEKIQKKLTFLNYFSNSFTDKFLDIIIDYEFTRNTRITNPETIGDLKLNSGMLASDFMFMYSFLVNSIDTLQKENRRFMIF